ncbi:hypothetical protein O9929_00960 [Vibrio lentus]|nr:hypothetical protein [Vibrio lentus]
MKHLVYASSRSSVYGLNVKTPFLTSDSVDHPVSLYAATKKSGRADGAFIRTYTTFQPRIRFFTVYGSWGRPDMAPFIFTKKILDGTPLI